MKNNKPTVTIGIPAYNEEVNIGRLLSALLKQKQDNFLLKKIIVVSDGSSDKTVQKAKEVENKYIEIISDNKRRGKAHRLNQLARMNKSDYLIFVDADSEIEVNAIDQMIAKFIDNQKLSLITGSHLTVRSTGFFERILSVREEILREIKKWKKGENVYAFRGGFLGLKEEFAKIIDIPNTVGTDAYLYFLAKANGYKVGSCEKAIIRFKLPGSIDDHLKQSHRFIDSKQKMEKYFGNVITTEYKLPTKLLFKTVWKVGKKRPIGLLLYLCLYLYSIALSHSRKPTLDGIWEISPSTKGVDND